MSATVISFNGKHMSKREAAAARAAKVEARTAKAAKLAAVGKTNGAAGKAILEAAGEALLAASRKSENGRRDKREPSDPEGPSAAAPGRAEAPRLEAAKEGESARRAAAEEELERLRARHSEQHLQNSGGQSAPQNDEATFADILAKVEKLPKGALPPAEAERLIKAAAWFVVSELARDNFLAVIKNRARAGDRIKPLLDLWNAEELKARLARAPSPEEAARLAAEAARLAEEAKRLEIDLLLRNRSPFAPTFSPTPSRPPTWRGLSVKMNQSPRTTSLWHRASSPRLASFQFWGPGSPRRASLTCPKKLKA